MNWRWINKLVPRKVGTKWFFPVPSAYDAWQRMEYAQYYNELPELNAVINIKARAFSNAVFSSERSQDRAIIDLINAPNWYQSGRELLYQTKLEREVYGNEFIYILRPFGMQNIKALYVLPAEKVRVKEASEVLFFMTTTPAIRFIYDGKTELDRENVIHFSSERLAGKIEGTSPLESLLPVLNNLRMAYQSRGVLLKYRGAMGIVSNESKDGIGNPFPIDPKEVEKIQEQYRNYGLLDNQYQLIFSNQSLRFIPMTVTPDRLGLFEEAREALNKVLDKYGVPSDLLTRQQGSTYENQRQAERGFYTRTIIPEMNEWISGINATFGTAIVATYTHLPFFQDDLKIRNEALNLRINALSRLLADGVISVDEYREQIENYI